MLWSTAADANIQLRRRWSATASILLALVASGCNRNSLGLVPAVGSVTLDGEPVEGASLLFMPTSSGPAASGVTDAHGRFVMKTANQPGAKVGMYRVSINKSQTLVKQVPGSSMPLYEVNYELPQQYASVESSKITAEVSSKSAGEEFKFELTRK